MTETRPSLRILGVRGIPARHGGFETFAEHLSLHLVSRGWDVVVYCQDEGGQAVTEDQWRGVRRVMIPSSRGSLGSVGFDWRAIRDAAQHRSLCLTLGYNTAVFCAWLRAAGVPNVINMDGIEWARGKWGPVPRLWLWLNDWAGCWLGDQLVADHPEIASHLATRGVARRVTMIPYGAPELRDAPVEPLIEFGLTPGRYFIVVARPEPENSILEIVQGHAASERRDWPLVMLGHYDAAHEYHRQVLRSAAASVRFPGAVYDPAIVGALRFHAGAYLHGHQVGGTNPSLVESLGAGCAIIAHDNRFNRWVAGEGAMYFRDAAQCARCIDRVGSEPRLSAAMRQASRERFQECFTLEQIHAEYEALLTSVAARADLWRAAAARQ